MPALTGTVGEAGRGDPDQVAQELRVLGVAEPHPGQAVGGQIADRVEAFGREVTVEVAEEAGDKGDERLGVVFAAHGRYFFGLQLRSCEPKRVSALHRPAHSSLSHDVQHSRFRQPGYMAVEAPDRDIAQFSGQLSRGQRPVAEERLHDSKPDRVKEEIGAGHGPTLADRSHL